ncbi:MAG: hypothetical protein DMF16_06470 [Verrucomicrobia bacterium]|nr:MAG: hypothetical protein DMF16_06470 [Verrucomicrobiota bacterium]
MSFSADSALEYLQRAQKKNRLAHAYLISGPAGSGKADVAARLAAARFKKQQFSFRGHGMIVFRVL